jgi:hypothetical protein
MGMVMKCRLGLGPNRKNWLWSTPRHENTVNTIKSQAKRITAVRRLSAKNVESMIMIVQDTEAFVQNRFISSAGDSSNLLVDERSEARIPMHSHVRLKHAPKNFEILRQARGEGDAFLFGRKIEAHSLEGPSINQGVSHQRTQLGHAGTGVKCEYTKEPDQT